MCPEQDDGVDSEDLFGLSPSTSPKRGAEVKRKRDEESADSGGSSVKGEENDSEDAPAAVAVRNPPSL